MSFDLDKFTAEPSVELLNLGKKTDLFNLAHFRAQSCTGETQESMNNVSCCRDMTEILLKAV